MKKTYLVIEAKHDNEMVKLVITDLTMFINAGPDASVSAYDATDNLKLFKKKELKDYSIYEKAF